MTVLVETEWTPGWWTLAAVAVAVALFFAVALGRAASREMPEPEPEPEPEPTDVSGNLSAMVGRRRAESPEEVKRRVVDLWNREGGWIPGAAYRQLAEALGVDTSVLTHWDNQKCRRVTPEEKR